MSHLSNNLKGIYAGFLPRLIAYAIDCLLFQIFWWIAFFSFPFDSSAVFFHYTLKDVLFYTIRTLLFAFFLYRMGFTPGKRVMGIRVVSIDGSPLTFGKALYRESVGRYLSAFISGIGYLFILFHPEKQALHDIISDTRVLRIDADASGFAPPAEDAPTEEASVENPEAWFDKDDVSVPFAPRSSEEPSEETTTEDDDTAASDETTEKTDDPPTET